MTQKRNDGVHEKQRYVLWMFGRGAYEQKLKKTQNTKKESRKSSMSSALFSLDAVSHTGADNNECKLSIVPVEV